MTRNQAVSWLRQIMMIIYGVVRRANEDFQMDERDIGDVMESRSFTNAMENGESVMLSVPWKANGDGRAVQRRALGKTCT